METETSQKQYESRHRLTWAARYPLKPGRDVASRRGLLVQIADTAITGAYWVSQEKLAERMGLTARHLRRKLVKLCDEGALRARPRGYKQTTIYTLMRLDEVAKHGDFLPLNGDATSDRTSTSSQVPPPFDRTSTSSQIGLTGPPRPLATGPPRPPKEAIVQEEIKEEAAAAAPSSRARAREPHENPPAAAAAHSSTVQPPERHTCPKCEKTWPLKYGPVCFTCQCDVELAQRQQELTDEMMKDAKLWDAANPPPPPKPPISKTAKRMNEQTKLPESWLYHQDLKRLLDGHDFREVCETIGAINNRELPEPEAFFDDYAQHRERYLQVEAEIKAGIEAIANPRGKKAA